MNIELLQGTLAVSENPGLETIDPRFTDIAGLVQDGRYEEAAAKAEAILAEQIYDIRVIGYFLYGHFVEQGILSLGDIFLCLSDLLGDQLEALGPAKNREKHIQNILNWLMKQTIKTLQYAEENPNGIYGDWVAGVESDQVQEALDAIDKLRRILGPVLENAAGPILEGLMKINTWLSAFQRLVYREPEPEPEEEQAAEDFEVGPASEREEDLEQVPRPREVRQGRISAPMAGEETISVEKSYHLTLLLKKLEAFDQLVSAQKFASAAIVADDINAIIANFDPRIYFPNLFVSFARQFATNINNLTAYAEYKESAGWLALKELFKVDLDSFVEFDPETIDLGASGAGGSCESPDDNESESEYKEY